ncbi:AsmA family protein [Sneathiella chinensis]|uniref:AsmA domain-containing protein n=1 Tax=Sneathiella chinensis TaxID=349750 RepID=A0ABQ5U059_9PROT|nr:AsmA family protein [Sneathiella chinensis]GLQ05597.1 hypothetical protein GCM10007924_08180 [Sneathiella chinensis]
MKRGLTLTMVAIAVLFCAAIVTIYLSIGSIIVDTIEQQGSEITQTQVTLEDVDYSPSTGLTTLTNLTVRNPDNFSSARALNVQNMEIWVDTETVTRDVIRIKSMVLNAPEIIYELTRNTDNLRTLRAHIEQSAARASSSGAPVKKLIIENFYVKNGVVVIEGDEIEGSRKTARISDLHLKDVGLTENGITPAEMTRRLFIPLLRQTTLAALETDLSLSGHARNLLNGALDETEDALKSLKKLFNN